MLSFFQLWKTFFKIIATFMVKVKGCFSIFTQN